MFLRSLIRIALSERESTAYLLSGGGLRGYWKRKLAAVTAEYKKWRMFYRNKILGCTNKDGTEMVRIHRKHICV